MTKRSPITKRLALIALVASASPTLGLKAEPYTTVLGDQKVTSVSRSPTKGPGVSREELLRAARDSVPIVVVVPTDSRQERKIK
jgi:hypothetical protein